MAGETQRKTDAAQQGCAENEYEPVSSIYTSELKSDDIVTDEFINGPGDNKSSSSEASEIARIADVSISDDVASCKDGPSLDERMKQGTLRIIEATMATTSTSIDLSKRKLQAIPDELSSLPYLEYIYLEGNEITHLPEDFFKMFPCLRWLDLRNNALSKIPSTHLSFHTCLRNLLLEGNNLHSLPLELGLMKSLHGLNIAGNPLAFPPQEIIERGTQCILAYLRDMFSKNCTDFAGLELDLSKDALERYENKSASSDDWNTVASMMDLAKKREMILEKKSKLNMNYGSEQVSGTKNIKQRSASCQMIEKLKKTGSVGKDDSMFTYSTGNMKALAASNCLKIKQVNVSKRASSELCNDIVRFFKKALRD